MQDELEDGVTIFLTDEDAVRLRIVLIAAIMNASSDTTELEDLRDSILSQFKAQS